MYILVIFVTFQPSDKGDAEIISLNYQCFKVSIQTIKQNKIVIMLKTPVSGAEPTDPPFPPVFCHRHSLLILRCWYYQKKGTVNVKNKNDRAFVIQRGM